MILYSGNLLKAAMLFIAIASLLTSAVSVSNASDTNQLLGRWEGRISGWNFSSPYYIDIYQVDTKNNQIKYFKYCSQCNAKSQYYSGNLFEKDGEVGFRVDLANGGKFKFMFADDKLTGREMGKYENDIYLTRLRDDELVLEDLFGTWRWEIDNGNWQEITVDDISPGFFSDSLKGIVKTSNDRVSKIIASEVKKVSSKFLVTFTNENNEIYSLTLASNIPEKNMIMYGSFTGNVSTKTTNTVNFHKAGNSSMAITKKSIRDSVPMQSALAPTGVTTVVSDSKQRTNHRRNYYALIIGINAYQHLTKLNTAIPDATAMEKLLNDKFGFKTTLLLDAKRKDILSALNRYRNLLGEKDNLLIYYAGHGVYDKLAEKSYWLPADAQGDDPTEWIIADDITSNIKRLTARHILIIADSCYSGTLTRGLSIELKNRGNRNEFLRKMDERPSRTLMASGGNEPVSDSGGGNHSIFAATLLKALDEVGKEALTAEELFLNRIKEIVAGKSEQVPEYSNIRNSGHDGGDFIFQGN